MRWGSTGISFAFYAEPSVEYEKDFFFLSFLFTLNFLACLFWLRQKSGIKRGRNKIKFIVSGQYRINIVAVILVYDKGWTDIVKCRTLRDGQFKERNFALLIFKKACVHQAVQQVSYRIVEVRFSAVTGIFLFTAMSKPALGHTQIPFRQVPGAVSSGREKYGPPSSSELKNEWSFTSTPPYVSKR